MKNNANFAKVNKNGADVWEVRLIDQTGNGEELWKRESFWQFEWDTFQPNGLNNWSSSLFKTQTLAPFIDFFCVLCECWTTISI